MEKRITEGPMRLINAVLGVMECRVCGSRHGASRHVRRYFPMSWQCSNKQCPTNQDYWDPRKKCFVKLRWGKLLELLDLGQRIGLYVGADAPKIVKMLHLGPARNFRVSGTVQNRPQHIKQNSGAGWRKKRS
jgi:hypothetical protein